MYSPHIVHRCGVLCTGIYLHQRPYIESMLKKYAPDGVPLSFQRNWAPCSGDLPELICRAMGDTTDRDPTNVKRYRLIVAYSDSDLGTQHYIPLQVGTFVGSVPPYSLAAKSRPATHLILPR